jgi:hypothetical protein
MMATGTSVSELESGGGEENLAEGEGNPKDPTTTLSAGGVGAVTGFCVAGPVGAIVVGTGWAYVASRPGKGGEIARASGRTLRATAAACTTLASVTVAKISSVNGKKLLHLAKTGSCYCFLFLATEKHGITKTIGQKLSQVSIPT